MFDTSDAKRVIPLTLYNSAILLLTSGAAENTTYNYSNYPEVNVRGFFRTGSYQLPENCSVTVNEETRSVSKRFCTCERARDGSFCVHEAGVLLIYASAREDGRISFHDIQNERTTSYSVKKYLRKAPVSRTGDCSGSLFLEPHVSFEDDDYNHALTVEFRIGKTGTKGYVLKSIGQLIRGEMNHEQVKFGKSLSFVPSEAAFEPACRPLYRFLKSISFQQDSFESPRGYYLDNFYGYHGSYLSRYLHLKGRYLDEFMDTVSSIGILFPGGRGRNSETCYYPSEDAPSFAAKFSKDDKGILFHPDSFYSFLGDRFIYFPDPEDHRIKRIPNDHSEAMETYLDLIDETAGDPVYIAPNDIRPFLRTAYPLIQKTSELETGEFDLSRYLPPKPRFVFYLDLPQANMITCEAYAEYSGKRFSIYDGQASRTDTRSADEEAELEQTIAPLFNSYDPEHLRMAVMDDDDLLAAFLNDGIPMLQSLGEVFISESLKRLQIRSISRVTMGVSLESNLLKLELIGDTRTLEDLAEILSRYAPKKKYYRLKNGSFVRIDNEEELENLARFSEDLQLSAKDIRRGEASLPSFRAMYIDKTAQENSGLEITRDEYFRELIDRLEDTSHTYEIPEHVVSILRDYQKDGFYWLRRLYDNHFAGLLADEMGLGKTLQVITFLSSLEHRTQTLVVCPASLVYNWKSEFSRFAPDIPAVMITGSAAARREAVLSAPNNAVLITSYDALKRDGELYAGKKFDVEVIDEAQYIKNANTKAAESVKEIDANFRIALTGTPIENRLSELWSIFDYLLPGFLYRYTRFRSNYEMPIVRGSDAYARERLQKMISPFILRRTKADVLKDLPEKLEEVYYAPLEGEQKELYEARRDRLKIMLAKESDDEFRKKRIEVLAELTRLRQTCCAPSLIYEGYEGNSAKEDLCIDLIRTAVEGGHKILLFSQFKTMLEKLNERLEKEGISYHFLSGETPKQKRAEMVDSFQQDDVPVFSISLKAGGTGLNLTAADIVIHYDPWWNTAVENQASDRAHRIGQTNIVTVYRLIVQDTIEESIIELQSQKADLASEILSVEEMSSSSLTREQLMDIL